MYAVCSQYLFGVSLIRGLKELIDLEPSLFVWGSIMLISIVAGAWSVAGAIWYGVGLAWNWLRLYPAGER
jgi:hypothetical protein